MKLKVVDARTIGFTPYGKLFNLRAEGEGLYYSCAADYTGSYTAAPVIDPGQSGLYQKRRPALYGRADGAPRPHAGGADTRKPAHCVSGCPATDARAPNAKDVKAVMIPKGYVAVLDRGCGTAPRTGCNRKLLLLAGECIRGRTDGMAAH